MMKALYVAAVFVSDVNGFMAPSRLSMSPVSMARSTVMKAKISIDDLAPKEFQLEELEDKEESETEVWLNSDGTVTLGKTNGPSWNNYKGSWHIIETAQEEDRPFRMRLTRMYDAVGHSGPNQVGDFSYEVTREFHGNVEMVGESISVTGKTHGIDEQSLLDAEVGYFTMIDAVASDGGIEGERGASP